MPAACSIGHRRAGRRDARVLAAPRAHHAVGVRAAPPVLATHQPGWPTEARQVRQLYRRAVLDTRRCAAGRAARPERPALDVHDDGVDALVVDAQHVDRGQANEQLAHARRVDLHRGSPDRLASEPSDSQSPCAAPGGPSACDHTPLSSEAPIWFGSGTGANGVRQEAPGGRIRLAGNVDRGTGGLRRHTSGTIAPAIRRV